MQADNHRFVAWGGPLELVLAVLGIVAWVVVSRHYIHRYPPEVLKAIRASFGSWRPGSSHDENTRRYFEAEFGPLTNPANQQKVFLSFFDPNQITAYQVMMSHVPAEENAANVAAAARWVAEYRDHLSPAEKSALRDRLTSPAGQAMVQQGTAQYETLGADFRGETTPIFVELLTTLKTLKAEQ